MPKDGKETKASSTERIAQNKRIRNNYARTKAKYIYVPPSDEPSTSNSVPESSASNRKRQTEEPTTSAEAKRQKKVEEPLPELSAEDAAKQRKFQKEFEALKLHLKRNNQDWDKMSDDFQVHIQWKFDKLKLAQQEFFFHLIDLWTNFIEQHLGFEKFGRLDLQWSWNCTIWCDWFVNWSASLVNESFEQDACWFIDCAVKAVSKRPVAKGIINKKSVFSIHFFRLFMILKHGSNAIENKDASHPCHTPACCNDECITIESNEENLDRDGCRYGFNFGCPHEPKCIWTDIDGKPIKCRNSTTFICSVECDCKTKLSSKFNAIKAEVQAPKKEGKRKMTMFTKKQNGVMKFQINSGVQIVKSGLYVQK